MQIIGMIGPGMGRQGWTCGFLSKQKIKVYLGRDDIGNFYAIVPLGGEGPGNFGKIWRERIEQLAAGLKSKK